MNRITKLLILITISLSVYFIYNNTNNKTIKIMSIGDSYSLGINSYGIKDYGYIDYYKELLEEENKEVKINTEYSKKDLSIKDLLLKIKYDKNIKRYLIESNIIVLNIGYNDLLYKLSLEEAIYHNNLNIIKKEIENSYNNLITEIKKYHNGPIIVVGYPYINEDNYYYNNGLRSLNKILKNNKNICYINTEKLLKDSNTYFSNPNNNYPNKKGYLLIAKKIIEKTLDI